MRTAPVLALAGLVATGVVSTPPAAYAQEAGSEAGPALKPPKLVKFVEADYPADKKAAGVMAKVLLSIEIDEDGRVGEVAIKETGGADFDAAATAAARRFVFEPAEANGERIPVRIDYLYDFKIEVKEVAVGPQVNFQGVILEKFKKNPMGGVKIRVVDAGAEATTAADGLFAFTDLPPGEHDVELSGPSLVTQKTKEPISKGKKRTVRYLVEEKDPGLDEEQVVKAPRIKSEVTETRIATTEARKVPGTGGDTLKVVQNLPGVGRSSFGSGSLVVWGSAPRETRVVVDGVEIPALYHVGGLRSVVSSDMVKSIDLAAGSYGAEYGRGLGGLVRVETKDLPRDGVHGHVAADVIDAAATLSAAPKKGVRFGVAGRLSYLDRSLAAVTSADVGDFVPIPRFDDYQARLTFDLRKDEELTAMLLGADDHLRRTIPSDDPSEVRTQNNDSSFKRLYLRYSRILDDGSSFAVTPSVGRDRSSISQRFGAVPVELDTDAWRYGLRGSFRRKLAASATLSAGLDLQGSHISARRVGSVNLPPREGDIVVFGQPPGDEINADDWRVNLAGAAPYAVAELNLGRLTVTPGLRVEPVLIDGSRQNPFSSERADIGFSRLALGFDPRLAAAFRLSKDLTLSAGGGIYSQAPDAEDLSAVFGNPTLTLSRAAHLSGGVAWKLRPTLRLEVVGFYKRLWDLISRSELPTPPVARALTQDGIGRVVGGQLLLRQELFKGFFGWLTYSLIRSERKDHADRAWRLLDYDQTHVVALLASYALPFARGWEVGARFRYVTGAPRTPVIGSYDDLRGDQGQPIFGAQNSIRIPAFYSLDARAERAFVLGGQKLSVFLDVQNVTDRKNPEEIVYNFNYTRQSYITGFPTLAILGAQWEF